MRLGILADIHEDVSRLSLALQHFRRQGVEQVVLRGDAGGKVRKTSTGIRKTVDGGFTLWTGSWEMFDLPPGVYTLELVATNKLGAVITSRSEKVLHGNPMK